MNICILSGRFPATRFASPANHRVYAHLHGYTYIHCNWPTVERNPYFNKLRFVQAYYRLFDYIFWIDDDAFFIDASRSLEPFLPPPGRFLTACQSPSHKTLKTPLSSGQFMLRCDEPGRRFIDQVLDVDLGEVARWWPDDLGFFTGGDQDAMAYVLMTDPSFEGGCELHEHHAFNSRLEDLERAAEEVFLLHFTGSERTKWRHYGAARKLLGTDLSLLPPATLASVGVAPVRPLPWTRRILRIAGALAGRQRTQRIKKLLGRLGWRPMDRTG